MSVLTVVSMLWNGEAPDGETIYTPEHVDALYRQVSTHLTIPHDFVCLTDNPKQDFAPGIHLTQFSPEVIDWPKCYRKLLLFSPTAKHLVGQTILYIDLDTVILKNINTLITNHDFRAWQGKHSGHYHMSMFLLKAQSRPRVWSEFNLASAPKITKDIVGSDQAWVSHVLPPGEATWGPREGMYSYKKDCRRQLPKNARVVHFHGKPKPWDLSVPWARAPFEGVLT